jgi:inorganic pyrophosphatase
MILHDVATTPGLVLRCKPIGVLAVMQASKGKRIRNDRIFAVPTESHREDELDDVRELPSEVKDELQTFFKATDSWKTRRSSSSDGADRRKPRN